VPACAYHCPTGALTYGERAAVMRKARTRVKQVMADYPHANLYGAEEFGGLRVLTILKDFPEKYGLPVKTKAIDIHKAEALKNTYQFLALFTMGLPSLRRMAYKMSRKIVG